ncbi:MAG: DMT family transporter [Puniceicoccaceae bacterium]|nr:MAG: DMT family transporter [Puniceicoccaceae bacterium]
MSAPEPQPSPTTGYALTTFAVVAGGSILFCSKGVVAKLAYAHGLDAISVLNLRMLMALPFFAGLVVWAAGGLPRLGRGDWLRLLGLGFLGYYLSSLVNFTGLHYISVGLERIILFTYPTLVLAISAVVLRRPVTRMAWLTAAVAWVGVACAFGGEGRVPVAGGNLPLGASLVFASAAIYAVFILLSGGTIARVGSTLFAGLAVGISCLFMMVHFLIVHAPGELVGYPRPVYVHGLLLAVFGTVLPAVLMSHGLRRAGPQGFAVMGAVGPVATLFLAWAVLGERPNLLQGLGLALALAGGLALALLRSRATG